MSQDLIAYFDQRFSETSHQIQQLQLHVEQQIQTLREDMKKGFEETDLRLKTEIRLTHVVIEGVRGEVRLVAESVAGLSDKVEGFQKNVSRELEPRVTRLENRVRALEAGNEEC